MKKTVLLAAAALVALACSNPKHKYSATVSGKITVADSLDDSGDFGNIEFVVLYKDTSAVADTLLRAKTSKTGEFKGKVKFPSPGRYPVEIRRFRRVVSSYSVLLGDGDNIALTAELPGFVQTAKVTSREQEAFDTYTRLSRNYDRIYNLAMRGQINPDTLPDIMRTWAGLYWEVFEQKRGTYASKLSAAEALRLYAGVDDSLVIVHAEAVKAEPMLGQVTAMAGMLAHARTKGLDQALLFVDEVAKHHTKPDDQGSFIRLKAEMLADSLRNSEAVELLTRAEKLGKEWPAFEYWRSSRLVDLTRLAPGTAAPDFTVLTGKDSLRLSSYKGKPVLIEFVGFANRTYMDQFDRIEAMHIVYSQGGLQFLTIPVDNQQAVYDGFFQERSRKWAFSEAGQFQAAGLAEKYNVKAIPCRVLVDKDGNIVRKYANASLELIFKDLQKQFAKEIPS
jgi:glutathione peroxidase-family protein